MTANAEWWRDKATLEERVRAAGSFKGASRAHGCSDNVLRKWWERHGLPPLPHPQRTGNGASATGGAIPPGVDLRGDEGTIVTEPTPGQLGDLDELLTARGLDPDEWLIERVTVNEWDSMLKDNEGEPRVVTLRQLKAFLKRRVRLDWVFPAVEVEERHVPAFQTGKVAERTIVVCGDQQAEYHDEELHAAFLRFLADVQPNELVLAGDTIDLPTISRHRDRPLWSAPVQACLNAGYRLLSDYCDAVPDARRRKIRGNHDWRLESELMARAERMFGIRPADIPGAEEEPHALSLRRLLHLDALGIELVGIEGDDWRYGEVDVAPGVVVRHQPPSMAKLSRLGRSVVAGDTHRQAIEHLTEYEADGTPVVRTLMQVGLMARSRGGLGYAIDPNWQQGFGTITVDAAGGSSFELATWRDGRLTWRGETW